MAYFCGACGFEHEGRQRHCGACGAEVEKKSRFTPIEWGLILSLIGVIFWAAINPDVEVDRTTEANNGSETRTRSTSTNSARSAQRAPSPPPCSDHVSMNFSAGGFISDSIVNLSVSGPYQVYVSGGGTNSYVSASASSGECVGGNYSFSMTVRTGLSLDQQQVFRGEFTIGDTTKDCDIGVDSDYISCR